MTDKQTNVEKEVYLVVDAFGHPILDRQGNPTIVLGKTTESQLRTPDASPPVSKSPRNSNHKSPLQQGFNVEKTNIEPAKAEIKKPSNPDKNVFSQNYAQVGTENNSNNPSSFGIKLQK